MRRYMAYLLVLAIFLSCQKQPVVGGSGTGGEEPGSGREIAGTGILDVNKLYGRIVDSSTGEGIPGVAVSDGYEVVVTDANGVYQMKGCIKSRYVFYSTPSAYKVSLSTAKTPLFYSTKQIPRSQPCRNDFSLEPLDSPEEKFTLVMIADPQVKSEATVSTYKATTMADLRSFVNSDRERFGNVYAFALGDLVNSTNLYDLWTPLAKTMERVALDDGSYIPVFKCIGNHDHSNKADVTSDYDADSEFVTHFGPTDYSLNRGSVHIVVMDNMVFRSARPSSASADIDEYITEERLRWLKADLDLVPDKARKTIVFCVHGPFITSNGKNYEQVRQLLCQFHEAHIMCGHAHQLLNRTSSHRTAGGFPLYEHTHATASGVRYNGNINRCGAPIGYGVYEIEGASVKSWVAKSVNFSEGFQMKVYNGADVYPVKYQTSQLFKWADTSYGAGWFIANVWNSDADNWRVDFVKDGVASPMRRIASSTDMNAASFLTNIMNLTDGSFTKTASLYVYKAPCGDPLKETGWYIRATQSVPGSGKTIEYRSDTFQRDYTGIETY